MKLMIVGTKFWPICSISSWFWLHPNQNTLRFVLETEYEKEHCPLEHADPKTSLRLSSRKAIEFNSPKSQIQFMDIPDIPVQTLYH